jgi:hypothetical protein
MESCAELTEISEDFAALGSAGVDIDADDLLSRRLRSETAGKRKANDSFYDDFRIDCGSAKLEIKGFLLLVVVAGCFFH